MGKDESEVFTGEDGGLVPKKSGENDGDSNICSLHVCLQLSKHLTVADTCAIKIMCF